MKTIVFIAATLFACFSASAQTLNEDSTTVPEGQAAERYEIGAREANQRVWNKVVSFTNASGDIVGVTNTAYVELATGLHYQQNGQWLDTKEEFTLLPGWAVARKGPHKVSLAYNLNTAGPVVTEMPDGRVMRSQVLSLYYLDRGTVQSVRLAGIKDCSGLLLAPNRILYTNAFEGVNADIRFTYTKSGIEQDIILRAQLPSPTSFGLNPATTRLAVLTEFITPPNPVRRTEAVSIEGNRVDAGSADSETDDVELDFGAMLIGRGKAFLMGDENDTTRRKQVPVLKRWFETNNRYFLFESVPLRFIQDELDKLPLQANAQRRAGRFQKATATLDIPQASTGKPSQRQFEVAQIAETPGFVLDYQQVNPSLTNYTFRGDTTYYITGPVNLYGTNYIEGGTVIKYTNYLWDQWTSGASLTLGSQARIIFNTDNYRPAVFTAKDDDTVGEIISGSTGSPVPGYYSGFAGINYSYLDQPLDVHDARFSYTFYGVVVFGGPEHPLVRNCQFTHNSAAIYAPIPATYRNLLIYDAYVGLASWDGAWADVEHLTINQAASSFFEHGTFNVTNSLFVGTSLICGTNYATTLNVANCATNTVETSVFRPVGAGLFYMTNNAYRNAGTVNIESSLLTDLTRRTTQPPVVYTNQTTTSDTLLSPQVARDTNAATLGPDLGYHYAPIDYLVNYYAISNATLAITNGTVIASYLDTSGIWLQKGASLTSSGSPTRPVQFTFYNTVQEQSSFLSSQARSNFVYAGMVDTYRSGAGATGSFKFTKFSGLANAGVPFYNQNTNREYASLLVQNCEFGPVYSALTIWPSASSKATFNNNLFRRTSVSVTPQGGALCVLSNNLFWGVSNVTLRPVVSGGSIYAFNNAFDSSALNVGIPGIAGTLSNNYNAYLSCTGSVPLTNSGPSNVITTSLAYQTGPLGEFYRAAGSALANVGSVTAASAGLYHFTVTTNQVKETNSMVDLGYHYVALGADGNPMDSDGDGIGDYAEDSNGNGAYDAGETGWSLPNVSWVTPTNGSVYGYVTNLTLTAAASDPVGITNVTFYRDGIQIGYTTNGSGGNYSFTWTNVPPGTFLMTAKAFNASGATTTSTQTVSMIVRSTALFVIATNSAISAADSAVSNELARLGFLVTTKGAFHTTTTDAVNRTVVVVSSSISSSQVTNKFRDLAVPFLAWEDGVYDDMDMTDATNHGTNGAFSQVIIINTNHMMAADLSGTVSVTTNSTICSYGVPTNTAFVIATNGTKPLIFGYEKSAAMFNGRTAPARRVGFFFEDRSATNLTANGWRLFDAAIIWACGLTNWPPTILAQPGSRVAMVGDSTSFTVTATDYGPFIYQWYFNQTNAISGATNASLTLTNLQLSNAGTYTVVVSYSGGSVASSPASLQVVTCFPAVDVLLVMDRSMSMTNSLSGSVSRLLAAKIASSNFVNNLDFAADKSGFETFAANTQTTLNVQLTNSSSALLQAIGQVTPTNGTYMSNALRVAQAEMLSARHNTNAGPVIVFLSDGEPDDPTNYIHSIATEIKNAGIRLVTVALSSQAGTNLMKAIASPNCYYYATTTNELYGVYDLVAGSICRGSNAIPTVQITYPGTNYLVFTTPTNILVQATAATTSGSMINVGFFAGTNLLGYSTSTNSSYSINWTNQTSGTNLISAVASNSFGLTATSAVYVIINNPPTANAGGDKTLIWPEGASSTNVTFSTSVASDDGMPNHHTSIQWSVVSDNGLVILSNSAWTTASAFFYTNGTYMFKMTVDDGFASASSTNTITIQRRPLIVLTSPAGNVASYPSNTLQLTAGAFDYDGMVTNVTFWNTTNGVTYIIGTLTNGTGTNYSFTWTNLPYGSNLVYATATDNDSLIQTSSPPVLVVGTLIPPTVQITYPASGQGFPARSTISITAQAITAFGTNLWVEFFSGTNSLGIVSTGSSGDHTNTFTNSWVPLVAGTNLLKAMAMNSSGLSAYSADVPILIYSLPSVTITNPVTNSVFGPEPYPVTLKSTASSAGSYVTNVAYFMGVNYAQLATNYIGNATSPPYSFNRNFEQGTYLLRARATDTNGATGVSPAVPISVNPTNTRPQVFAGDDQVVRLPNTVDLAGFVTDDGLPLGSSLSVVWTNISKPAGATISFSNPTQAVTVATCSALGVYTNRLLASDGVLSNEDEMVITIIATNLPPVVRPGINQTLIDNFGTQLLGVVTDDGQPTGGQIVSTWALLSGPGEVNFANTWQTNTFVHFGAIGTYVLQLSATDGEQTASSNLTVVVGESVVPYKATNYLYMWMTQDGLENYYQPDSTNTAFTNFYAVGFDDAAFTNGPAAFGSGRYFSRTNPYTVCNDSINNSNYVGTYWPGSWFVSSTGEIDFYTNFYPQLPLTNDYPYLMVRRHFNIPVGTTNLSLAFAFDNDIRMFLNGVAISNDLVEGDIVLHSPTLGGGEGTFGRNGCAVYEDVLNLISPTLWHPGDNVIAFLAHDSGGAAFADIRLSLNSPFAVSNTAPAVIMESNVVVAAEGVPLHLSGTIIDDGYPGNARGVAEWSMKSGPGWVEFDPGSQQSFTNFAVCNTTATLHGPGVYEIQLIALDGFGAWATNKTVVLVSDTNVPPPTVSLQTPTNGSTFSVGSVVVISANAMTATGEVAKVAFFASDGTTEFLLGEVTSAPYSVNWITTAVNNYVVHAEGTDQAGRVGISPFVNVHVISLNSNHPPVAGKDYFTVLANSENNILFPLANDTDAEGDALIITSVTPPENGAVELINDGTAIRYTPPFGVRSMPGIPADGFTYYVSDGHGGTAKGGILIYIEASDLPMVNIASPTDGYTTSAGTVVPITAHVSPYANTNIVKVEFFEGVTKIGTVTNGSGGDFTYNWTAMAAHDGEFTAQATDRFGQVNTSASININVTNNPNLKIPTAALNSTVTTSATNAIVTTNLLTVTEGLFDLYGKAFHPDGSNVTWQLGVYSTEGTLLRDLTPLPRDANGECTTNVGAPNSSNLLAKCDFTTLPNDIYDLVLTVTGGFARTNTSVRFRLESNLKIGQFSFSQQDLVIPAGGVPLTVVRTYNSLDLNRGDFGYSWKWALNDMDVKIDEERADVTDLDGDIFSQRVGGGRNITLTLPDGRRTTFYFKLRQTGVLGAYAAEWVSAPDVRATNMAVGDNILHTILGLGPNGQPYWQASGTGTPMDYFDFPAFTLRMQDGTEYTLSREKLGGHEVLAAGGASYYVQSYGKPYLSQVKLRTGETIHINSDAIVYTDANNVETRRILFERNGRGLISAVTDPNGTNGAYASYKYEYDNQENLIRVLQLVDRATGAYVTNSFGYTNRNFPHYITDITDARGVEVAKNFYDDDGRLTGVQDANGKLTQFIHSVSNNLEVTIDRLGFQNTYVYDLRGNVTRITNALQQVTVMEYNSLNQKIAETNALDTPQQTWAHYAYDAQGNQTSVISSPNHTNSFTYDVYGNMTSQIDSVGNMTTNIYDGAGNLTGTTQYDVGHNPITQSSSVYDSGRLTMMLDANGHTNASFGYDGDDLIGTTDARGMTRSFGYDANGNQTSTSYVGTNYGGGAVTVTTTTIYDAAGRVTMSIGATGSTNRMAYYASGRIDYTVDRLGNTNSFFYDKRGNLVQSVYPNGTFTRTVYDDNARPVYTMDRNGVTGTRTDYDALGRATNTVRLTNVLIEVAGGGGIYTSTLSRAGTPISTNSTEYLPSGWVANRAGADRKTNWYSYYPDGQLQTVTNSLQEVTYYQYDLAGRQTNVVDALNRAIQFKYDALGRQTATIFADTKFVTNIFNNLGQRTGVKDQAGRLTQFAYDNSGVLTSVTKPQVPDPDGGSPLTPVWSYQYDAYGRLAVTVDPNNNGTTNRYDELGREISRSLPMGQTASNVFNSLGQLTKQYDFKGQRTEFVYDRFGRTKAKFLFPAATDTPEEAVCYRYDQLGQLTNIVQRYGVDADTNACDGYAAMVGHPLDTRTRTARVVAWVKREVPTEAGGAWVGVVLVALSLLGIPMEFRRRAFILVWENVKLQLLSYQWDTVLRPKRLRLPSLFWRCATLFALVCLLGSDQTFQRWWEARASCGSPDGNYSTETTRQTYYQYDFEGRLIQVNCPEGEINYGYDLATGRHTHTCTANLEVGYGYDDLGRLATVTVYKRNGATLTTPEVTSYTYTAVGSRATVTLPNQTVTTYLYDSLNRLTNLTHLASNNVVLASYSYKVDETGRRTNAVEILRNTDDSTFTTNTLHWQYDAMYRLTREVNTNWAGTFGLTNTYAYDAAGNRVRQVNQSSAGMKTVNSTYNANDQLLTEITNGSVEGTNSYAYDDNGSVIAKTNAVVGEVEKVTTYSYSAGNKLKEMTSYTTTERFQYNDAGIRVRRWDSSYGDRYYLVDANNHTGYTQVLEERYSYSSPLTSYVIGDDVLGQCTGESDPSWLLYDGHGSTRQVATGIANVTSQYHYDSYGQALTSIDDAETSLLYCGEQFDAGLGMYNLRARYYDPSNGRFNAMDAFRGNTDDPQSLHKYAYATLDPANGLDPSGMMTAMDFAVWSGIAVTVSTFLWLSVVKKENPITAAEKAVTAGALTVICILLLPEVLAALSSLSATSPLIAAGGKLGLATLASFFAVKAWQHLQEINEVMFGPNHTAAERSVAFLELITFTFVLCTTARSADPASSALDDFASIFRRSPERLEKIVEADAQKVSETSGTQITKAIPEKAKEVLKTVRETGKAPEGYVGGRVFKNREGKLPDGGAYKEYDVDPKPAPGVFRNALRIVIDEISGRAWYTDDHYETFTEIK